MEKSTTEKIFQMKNWIYFNFNLHFSFICLFSFCAVYSNKKKEVLLMKCHICELKIEIHSCNHVFIHLKSKASTKKFFSIKSIVFLTFASFALHSLGLINWMCHDKVSSCLTFTTHWILCSYHLAWSSTLTSAHIFEVF